MDDFQDTLRRLTIRDDRFIASVLASDHASTEASSLDCKSHALVRLGALIAVDAAPQSYAASVEAARLAGATDEEIVGTLVATLSIVGPPRVEAARLAGATDEEIVGTLVATLSVVGPPRVVSAAPKLGLALGYDLDAALESASS